MSAAFMSCSHIVYRSDETLMRSIFYASQFISYKTIGYQLLNFTISTHCKIYRQQQNVGAQREITIVVIEG